MTKNDVQWRARPAWDKLCRDDLYYSIGLVITISIFVICSSVGVRVSDNIYSIILWLLLGAASFVFFALELYSTCTRIMRIYQTRYVLTEDSLYIAVSNDLKIVIPVADLPNHNYLTKNNYGLVDIHIDISGEVNIVLRDIREDDRLYEVFGIPLSSTIAEAYI